MSLLALAPQVLNKHSIPTANGEKTDEIEAVIEELEKNLIIPLLNVPLGKVESFLDQNLNLIKDALQNFSIKIFEHPDILKSAVREQKDMPEVIKDLKLGKIGSAYSKDIYEKLIDTLELETFNENYLLSFGGEGFNFINIALIVMTKLEKAGIDFKELSDISIKLGALIFTIFDIIARNDAAYEPKLKEIVSLAAKYAEKKDDILTILQILIDKDLEKEADEAYNEAISGNVA